MIRLLLSLTSAILIGFFFTMVVWPQRRPKRMDYFFSLFLSVGLGTGLVSIALFLFLRYSAFSPFYFFLEAALCGLPAFFCYRKVAHPQEWAQCATPLSPSGEIPRSVLVVFAATLVLGAINEALLCLEAPHGSWDAWAMWNARAKLLYTLGGDWNDCSHVWKCISHADYPLLIPVTIARLWFSIGQDTVVAPMVVAYLFTFATAGMLVTTLWIIKTPTNAMLAFIALMGTRHFLAVGAAQYSDVPLSFFFLSTLCLFLVRDVLWKDDSRLLFLAGVCASLGVWTKNEGWLFLIVVLVARFLVVALGRGWRCSSRELRPFVCGMIPVLAVALYYRIFLMPTNNDLVTWHRLDAIALLLKDGSRYQEIAKGFVSQLFVFHRWGYMAIALLIYPFLAGVALHKELKWPLLVAAATLGLMLVGFFCIYIITPHDLVWHLNHSLDRLFVQLWPSFLLTYFCMMKSPEIVRT